MRWLHLRSEASGSSHRRRPRPRARDPRLKRRFPTRGAVRFLTRSAGGRGVTVLLRAESSGALEDCAQRGAVAVADAPGDRIEGEVGVEEQIRCTAKPPLAGVSTDVIAREVRTRGRRAVALIKEGFG